MKKIIVFITLLLVTMQSYSQDTKGYIGFSLGPSIPMGDLASKDINKNSAGFAETGAFVDLSFAYKLGGSNFGITALLRAQANSTNLQSMANALANEYPGYTWTIESDGWALSGLMFGGFGSFPVSENVSFDTKAMIGFLNAGSPNLTITVSEPGGTGWISSSRATTRSFAYLIGAGFKFSLGKKLYLLTNLDYIGSNPEFTDVETKTSDGNRSTDTWSQKMGTMNFGIGIALKI